MLIDSHLHLNDKEFDHDLQEVIDRAQSADVRLMVVNGYDIASSQRALDISHDHPGVYATCGIHPSEASKVALNLTILQNLLNDPKVIGIGEIGLDYYW
ncbi:MAG: TatD family hydrolase, partial [Bacilli bacterium]|nr:TatD family hydrolase [Bacilli bacterium]